MKLTLIALLFTNICLAQERHDAQSIARMEMSAHESAFSNFTAGSSASDNFDVKYYRLEWEINPAVRYINGKVTVIYKMLSPGTSIALDLMSVLTVSSVTQHGGTLSFSQPSNTLLINFPAPVNAGYVDSLTINYAGIPANTGFGSFILDSHAGTPVAWSLSEAYGARDWWPCKNGINDKADSIDVYITHPAAYKAASNGILQSATPAAGNKTMTHWKHRYPIASYLVCMAITNYAVFNNSVQLGNVQLPMVTYCYPEDLASFQTNTPKVLEAMQLFHNSFGPYPFINEKYGHVQFGWGGGMEHQTSTFVINAGEALMAHELGHQWFGDKITCASWEDIWLNEGFATFAAAYYMEKKYPDSARNARKLILESVTALPDGSVKVPDTLNLSRVFDQRLSYDKGSKLLDMLRQIIGEEIFLKALRRYQQDPALAYANARTADFRRNIEAESGRDLGYFFKQWYEGEGHPSYTVKWRTVGSSSVQIQLNQTTSHSSVPFFRLPVPLRFKKGTQEQTIILDNSFSGQIFLESLSFVPDTVIVDPEYWFLTKNNSQQKLASMNSGEGIAEVYPNPVTDPFTIYLHDFNDNTARINIYDKAGREMYRKDAALINGAELISVPSSSWAKGVYIIRISAGDKTIVRQMIK